MPLTEEQKKEWRREYNRKYHQANKEKINEAKKKYYQENKNKKHMRYTISNWKSRGVKYDDYVSLYNKYMNTEYCECCGCKLTTDKVMTLTTRCLDHCHITGLFRRVICNGCNIKLPRQPKQIKTISLNNIENEGKSL
jgi:hypothetical protein